MITDFDSHIKGLIPSLNHVKKVKHQSDGPLIKLEWCGMQCSGKYGLLTKVDDYGTEKIGTPVDQSKLLCSWYHVNFKIIHAYIVTYLCI